MSHLLRPLHSFKLKITITVTLMVLIAAVGVGGIALLISETAMRETLARQQLSMLTSAAAFIENDLLGKQRLIRSLSEQRPGEQIGAGEVQSLLEAHSSLREEFYNVIALDPAGKMIANLKDRRAISKGNNNFSSRPYFRQTVASREGLISAPFKSALSGKPVVALTQPIHNASGQLLYVLVAVVDLVRPSFSAQLAALDRNMGGYLFIVNAQGVVIHHPNQDFILQQLPAGTAPLIDAALADDEGWQDDLLDDNVPSLLVHKRLHRVDWTVVVSRPLQSVFSTMMDVRLRAMAAIAALTLLAAGFGWAIARALLRPLGRLHAQVVRIDAGDAGLDVLETARHDEFGMLSRAFHRVSARRDQLEQDLRQLASTDALTGVYNRRMFDSCLPQALARNQRHAQPLGLAMLDIDQFKLINDSHGHAAGDAVLVEFARRLKLSVRACDTVARLAGDEFVVIFDQLSSAAEAELLGQRILATMSRPFDLGGHTQIVSASVGIAVASAATTTADTMMAVADAALYRVKASGRNGCAVQLAGPVAGASLRAA